MPSQVPLRLGMPGTNIIFIFSLNVRFQCHVLALQCPSIFGQLPAIESFHVLIDLGGEGGNFVDCFLQAGACVKLVCTCQSAQNPLPAGSGAFPGCLGTCALAGTPNSE